MVWQQEFRKQRKNCCSTVIWQVESLPISTVSGLSEICRPKSIRLSQSSLCQSTWGGEVTKAADAMNPDHSSCANRPFGFHGRYLRIDLSSNRHEVVQLSNDRLKNFIGGIGLATSILLEQHDYQFDALSPESSIVFCFSSLVGSPITTSAKFAVVSKSPLTQRLNDAMAGSSFAIAGKRTGYDAINLTGRAAQPSVVLINNGNIEIVDAGELWGMTCGETERELSKRFGKQYSFATIGPAGENLVRYATISHDGRHAGRGGSGAVLGSKYIKAIGVAGDARTEWADRESLIEASKRLSKKSLGKATEKYRELGTVENLVTLNRLNALPTRNFQAGRFEYAEQFDLSAIAKVADKTRSSCAACTIGCEHIYKVKSSSTKTDHKARLEYENLFALGPLCGIDDIETVIRASSLCDELGMDTISAGATIAFVMECVDKGLLNEPLHFGNSDELLNAIVAIGNRTGFGDEMAEGTMRLSKKIGKGTDKFAPHVKGMEIPGYEPRALKTMALGFAVQTRGADHNRSGAYDADFEIGDRRFQTNARSATDAIETENRAAIIDSMILCKFVRRVFEDFYSEAAELLNWVTGWDYNAKSLNNSANRIVSAKKLYNIYSGWLPEQDQLPDRFFSDSTGEFGEQLDREKFQLAIQSYNTQRGWTEDGFLQKSLLEQLELTEFDH